MAERFITPLESKQLTSPYISEPIRLNHEYGRVQKIGEDLSANLLKMYEESKANLKASYMSDYQREINEFESKLQYDKSYYQDPSKIAELKERLQLKKDEFKKMAEDMEFFSEDMDEINNATDTLNLRVETAYKTKYVNWREQEIKEDYLAEQLQKAQNNRTTMMLGYRENAVNDFHSTVKSFEKGIDNDYLTEENAIKDSLGDRLDLITANVMSYTNKENAMAIYEQMSKMTFEEFRESYKDTIFKLKGKNYDLTDMEYEAFKRSIDSGLNELKRRGKAQEELTKVQEEAYKEKLRTTPVLEATKELNILWGEDYAPVLEDLMTLAANNRYGSKYGAFTSPYDVIKYNLQPLGLEKGFNLPIETYNDPNSTGEIIMSKWAETYKEGCAGKDEALQRAYMDSALYQGVIPAVNYQIGKTYFKGNGNLKRLYNEVNQRPYNELAQDFTNQNISVSSALFDVERNLEAIYNNAGQETLGIKKNVSITTFGKIQGMKEAGKYDVRIKAMFDGIDKMYAQTFIKVIYDETNGLVTEDIADELDLKDDSVGMSLTSLKANKKQELINYMASRKDVMEKFDKLFKPAFDDYTKGYKAVDLGNGNLGYIKSEKDPGILQKELQTIIDKKDLRTKNGEIPPKKGITIRTFTEDNNVVFVYNDEILQTNGEPYIFDLNKKEE